MEQARSGLVKIMGELLGRAPAEEAPVLAWPAVCGQAVANRTRALDFNAGRLRVEVPDVAWRTQLAELELRYRKEFELVLGPGKVRKIDFVPAVPQAAPLASQAAKKGL